MSEPSWFSAVRRLRLLIEDDAAPPSRIVTLDDGYGFGDGETVRRWQLR
jgi:hypothetical protein